MADFKELKENDSKEISDDDLGAVAGGYGGPIYDGMGGQPQFSTGNGIIGGGGRSTIFTY